MFHKVILVGNLGRDPEMRYTPSGTPVTNLSVATDRKYKNSAGDLVTETVWFKVAAWGKQAESCNTYLRKGRQVLVEGRLTGDENGNPRIWTGQDGAPRASYEINAESVRFLGSRPADVAPVDNVEMLGAAEVEDDIPF